MAPPEYAHNRGVYELQIAGNPWLPIHALKLNPERNADEWRAWEELNFRPHAYQARALTN